MRYGLILSTEEYAPAELLEQARSAQAAGFQSLWISDHFHPWLDVQGSSPFVWSMIGALSQTVGLPITTAVTCPTVRLHPALVAQAAATSSVLTGGRFTLGLGSGEALNEHITGSAWPPADTRLGMLTEAVDIIRRLLTGDRVTYHGRYYTVENARIYTLPDQPPPLYISGLAPGSTRLAGRIGDGYIGTRPDRRLVSLFRSSGGGSKMAMGGMKGCYAGTRREAVEIAHRIWPTSALPGELGQVLPEPAHFEQAASLVTPEMIERRIPCGPDPRPYRQTVEAYAAAGYDELYVAPIGPHYSRFIEMFAGQVMPAGG